MSQEKQERLNITLSKADGEILEQLQEILSKELMMRLSKAQVVRRLLMQAVSTYNS